ncbi:M48 family metallopeptidase [Elongatibacter sediminis]|uniref:M48 family metallopeptidase n=1 Tax=Elongatibacter sediminis TaxID=3119006 RepID=A0AAW9RKN1_9GAMM
MNFFGHQAKARRQTRWLVVLFVMAVVTVVAAVDLVVLLVLGFSADETGVTVPLSSTALRQNWALLATGAAVTGGLILIASLYRSVRLRAGGGQVARDLGGTLVDSDVRDPLRRRLRNVVEEIAIASGVPVPEIYVLEHEAGINAFAAGYTPADAAVAVTRGTLERLDRNELQGVIAHEFSHILNGDMRLNIRLMGALFGIMVLTLIGRRILLHSRHFGRSRDKGVAAVLLIALGVMIVGSVGQFFGRWIKAAVSRQREYLADASAVQFTRDTTGISGALKKIAAYRPGSSLETDAEEISHMLFSPGGRMFVFATHPPIDKRIRRVDPGFDPSELDRLAAEMVQEDIERAQQLKAEREQARAREANAASGKAAGPGGFDAGRLISEIGQPGWERLLMAATLAAAIPLDLRRAAESPEWAPEVLFYTLLDPDPEVREQQLLEVARHMGAQQESSVRALLSAAGPPVPEQRLPLLELAFPALKRRPDEYVQRVLATVKKLVEADGRIDVFEFLLSRVIAQHVWESRNPHTVRVSGRASLDACADAARRVLAVLARHGHGDDDLAAAAFRAGADELEIGAVDDLPPVPDWMAALDEDLPRLDRLRTADKERLVRALTATVTHDGEMAPVELELLRAVCDLIHVPLPLLGGGRAVGGTSPG